MAECFLGEIRLFGFEFAPKNWALCNGQIMPIAQNQGLFALLGTMYGGNGVQNFALPGLAGRVPLGYGPSVDPAWPSQVPWGEQSGTETVTLLSSNLPAHTHLASVAAGATTGTPGSGAMLASSSASKPYRSSGSEGLVPLAPTAVSSAGGNGPHPNLQPYLALSFAIALQGTYPSRN